MGDFIDKTDNIIEELIKIIPSSFYSSEEFQKGCQVQGYSQRWYICSTSVSMKNTNMFASSSEKTELTLDKFCHELSKNSIRALYKFVSFLIKCFCETNDTKVPLNNLKSELRSIGIAKFDNIEEYDTSDSSVSVPLHSFITNPSNITNQIRKPQSSKMIDDIKKKSVFIVHGHDDSLKTNVENVLMKLGLEPIVLAQQPNEGDTIFDKFEKNGSRADYAIILLTADDKGKAKDEKCYNFRARQNVIFEMGYFVAKLGRKNICYLYEKDVEIPSDLKGIAYVSIKGDKWPFELVNELKTRGFDVSADKLLK